MARQTRSRFVAVARAAPEAAEAAVCRGGVPRPRPWLSEGDLLLVCRAEYMACEHRWGRITVVWVRVCTCGAVPWPLSRASCSQGQ